MNKSESIANIGLALSKAQGELQDVYKDKKGYGYNYADLSSILEISRPACSKHELAVLQPCSNDGSSVTVETMIIHSSGEWLSSVLTLPLSVGKGMSHAQAVGSCITYGRRYGLAAMLGISQTDDDATLIPAGHTVEGHAESNGFINAGQLKVLKEVLIKSESDIPMFCKYYGVESVSEIKATAFDNILKTLNGKILKLKNANAMKALADNKSTPEIDIADHADFHAELGEVDTETGEVI